MNVLLLTEDFHPNIDGGALVRSRFTELVADTPHDLTVVTGRTEETGFTDQYHGADVFRPVNPSPNDVQGYELIGVVYRILFSLSVCAVGLYLLWKRDVDVIYSKSYSTHWAGKVLSLLFRRPLLTFIGGTPSLGTYRSSRIKLLPEWINIRLFMGDFVYTRTPQTCHRVSRISGKPTDVLHGVLNKRHIRDVARKCDPEQIRAEYDVEATEYLIAFVGRLVPLKAPERAVDVLSALPPDYSLVLIGDGPEFDALQERITEQNLEDRVHLTGQLPHHEALEILCSADMQLVTSKIEAYPSVVFEGLALNNEVFTRDVGIVSEIPEESLHVTDDFVEDILSTSVRRTYAVDERILDEYSIERYTSDSLDTMEQLVERE